METTPNRFEQARMLMGMYQGVVDDDKLRGFVQALIASDEPAPEMNTKPRDPDARIVVRGNDAYSDNLIYLPLNTALCMAESEMVSGISRTWGELRANGDTFWIGIAENFSEDHPDYRTFPEFRAEYRKENPKATYDEAWNEYRKLSPLNERCIFDDDPFDRDEIAELDLQSLSRSDFPKEAMYGTMPGSLVEKFGSVGSGFDYGPDVEIPLEAKEDVDKGYEELGYVVIEDQMLVDALNRLTDDYDALERQIDSYCVIDEMCASLWPDEIGDEEDEDWEEDEDE
jgi:hypothetical protein